MITNGEYTLRAGREGDTPPHGFAGVVTTGQGRVIRKNIPDWVLVLENEQIGAMTGKIDLVLFIEIFEPHRNKGHGQKFVELLEIQAKKSGYNQIVFYPVTSDVLENILQKRGYTPTKDKKGDKTYSRSL